MLSVENPITLGLNFLIILGNVKTFSKLEMPPIDQEISLFSINRPKGVLALAPVPVVIQSPSAAITFISLGCSLWTEVAFELVVIVQLNLIFGLNWK